MRTVLKLTLGTAVIASAALLGGCAGRPAAPVPVSEATDPYASCQDLLHEVMYNQQREAALVRESQHVKAGNADVVGGDSFFFPPVLAAYDKGKAQSTELKALEARNANLTKLAVDKGC